MPQKTTGRGCTSLSKWRDTWRTRRECVSSTCEPVDDTASRTPLPALTRRYDDSAMYDDARESDEDEDEDEDDRGGVVDCGGSEALSPLGGGRGGESPVSWCGAEESAAAAEVPKLE